MNAHGANRVVIYTLAIIIALLVCRLIVLLMAARPDNSGVAVMLSITEYIVWPLAWVDASQPVFGSRFERGTLALIFFAVIGLRIYVRRSPIIS